MAYVVARPKGRFEVRESLHTPNGPRARSLAGFRILSDEILAASARRAERPFDAEAVIASGRRAGAPVTAGAPVMFVAGASTTPVAGGGASGSSERFVQASRRMVVSTQRRPSCKAIDPGQALIDLLGFADAVRRSQPRRPLQPLAFPVLARLVQCRRGLAGVS